MELPDNLVFNCIFADHDQGRSETIEKTPPPYTGHAPHLCSSPYQKTPCEFAASSTSEVPYFIRSSQAWKHTAAKPRLRPASAKLRHGDITKRATKKAQNITLFAFSEN
jgi:hypothetical protein